MLVIGASSDIGTATIKELGKEYDFIIAHYNHMNDNLKELKECYQGKLKLMQADLLDDAQVDNMLSELKSMDDDITHVLHLPAVPCDNAKFHKIKWEVFQREMEVSVKSLVRICQTVVPAMMKARYGRIVVMLSFVVDGMPPKYCSNYITTKYALLGLMKALAVEYADKGITVNGISPAWVETKYLANQPDYLIAKNAELSPIGRNLTTDDLTPTIQYLLSDGAGCVNGQNISITCGR